MAIDFESIVYNFGIFCLINIFIVIVVRIGVYLRGIYKGRAIVWRGGPDTWAVVTGCTDGIGLEFSRQLAQKGYNLLLLSRNIEKLNKVRDELKERYKDCEVRVLAVDFRRTDIYEKIDEELKKLQEIHVLVNNVGVWNIRSNTGYNYGYSELHGLFLETPRLKEYIPDAININVLAGTRLTASILPRMEERGRGIIINLSSLLGLHPAPNAAIFSATKAYIDFLSRALSEEYKNKGIIIQSLIPGFVDTKMSQHFSILFKKLPAEEYVASALKTVGKSDRCTGHYYFDRYYLLLKLLQLVNIIYDLDIIKHLFIILGNVIRNINHMKSAQMLK